MYVYLKKKTPLIVRHSSLSFNDKAKSVETA